MNNFDRALPIILIYEGGYVDNPRDPGGATNLGVTLATLSDFRGQPATKADVRALTPAQVAPIYLTGYWRPAGCESVAAGLDLLLFDTAVNVGLHRAVRWLQAAAGAVPDGLFGPGTLEATRQHETDALIDAVSATRRAHYQSLPTFPTFGKGWMSRLGKVTETAHEWAKV